MHSCIVRSAYLPLLRLSQDPHRKSMNVTERGPSKGEGILPTHFFPSTRSSNRGGVLLDLSGLGSTPCTGGNFRR